VTRRRTAIAALLATAIPVAAWAAADFTYDTPQTGYYSIHPMSFAPDGGTGSGGFFNRWKAGVLEPDQNVQQCLNAGVNLPDGAVVKEVQVWFSSNGVHELYTTLMRTELGTGSGRSIGGGVFRDSSGNRVTRTSTVGDAVATIDNAKYQYGFGVCIQGTTTFQGARIKYTYRSAGD
jgi:hypothetical protein